MNAQESMQRFATDLGELVNLAVGAGVPMDFMASRFAAAEFELRTEILSAQRARVKEAANGVIELPRR